MRREKGSAGLFCKELGLSGRFKQNVWSRDGGKGKLFLSSTEDVSPWQDGSKFLLSIRDDRAERADTRALGGGDRGATRVRGHCTFAGGVPLAHLIGLCSIWAEKVTPGKVYFSMLEPRWPSVDFTTWENPLYNVRSEPGMSLRSEFMLVVEYSALHLGKRESLLPSGDFAHAQFAKMSPSKTRGANYYVKAHYLIIGHTPVS